MGQIGSKMMSSNRAYRGVTLAPRSSAWGFEWIFRYSEGCMNAIDACEAGTADAVIARGFSRVVPASSTDGELP